MLIMYLHMYFILSFCLSLQLRKILLLRPQRNENRNGKGRKNLQKWVDTGAVAGVEVLAVLHQGT
jgi:hypothetical protein